MGDLSVALRKESVDRNLRLLAILILIHMSLSARRAWIEISISQIKTVTGWSLSARRAWIEIYFACPFLTFEMSLSARRAWIEIIGLTYDGLIASGRSPQGERG